MLREYDVAPVCADTLEWPRLMAVTTAFVHCRLHGFKELYAGGCDDAALDAWAAGVRVRAAGGTPEGRTVAPQAPRRKRDIVVYFDNGAKVRAPLDARALMRRR